MVRSTFEPVRDSRFLAISALKIFFSRIKPSTSCYNRLFCSLSKRDSAPSFTVGPPYFAFQAFRG